MLSGIQFINNWSGTVDTFRTQYYEDLVELYPEMSEVINDLELAV